MFGKRAVAGEISAMAARRGRERPAGFHGWPGTGEKSSYVGISTNSTWGFVFPSCSKKKCKMMEGNDTAGERSCKRYALAEDEHMMPKQHML